MRYSLGFGALVWVYSSERFPDRLRTAGASTMLTGELVGNLLIAQFSLSVLGRIGGVATFSLFLGLAVVSLAYVFALAPETKGRPLEAIRLCWENGGRWPADAYPNEPAAATGATTVRDERSRRP